MEGFGVLSCFVAFAARRVAAIEHLGEGMLADEEIAQALAQFDSVWESLNSAEQARILQLLIERVVYDSRIGEIAVTFRATGIEAFANEEVTV